LVELTAGVGVERIDATFERGEFARQNGMRRRRPSVAPVIRTITVTFELWNPY
jgi:hypothetical protein